MQLFRSLMRPARFYGFSNQQIQRPEQRSISESKTVSSTIVRHRREMDRRIKKQHNSERDLEVFNIAHQDIVISVNLYGQSPPQYYYRFMRHDCSECQLTHALMNYYGDYQPHYSKTQNLLSLDDIRKAKYIALDEYEWPVMKVQVSLYSPQFYSGHSGIFNYLVDSGLIPNAKHLTHSAWSQQGQEFVKNSIEQPLALLFLNPFLTWQNVYKTSPEAFKKDGKSANTIRFLLKLIKRGIVQCSKNLAPLISNRAEYKNSRQALSEGLTQWKERLQGKDYHGGSVPDEADFEVHPPYRIMARHNSYSFRKFLENQAPSAVYSWFIRMQQVCRYEENRFYTEEGVGEE